MLKGIVYHGSMEDNIEILTPQIGTHRKKCVYATRNKCVSLLFANRGNKDLDTMIGTINGKLIVVERREGVLKELYDHKGYIYVLDDKTFSHYKYLWSKELISFSSVKVKNKIEVPNILKKLENEEVKKHIKIYHYPDRPSSVPLDNSDLITKYKIFEERGLKGSIDKLLSVYPEFKDRL